HPSNHPRLPAPDPRTRTRPRSRLRIPRRPACPGDRHVHGPRRDRRHGRTRGIRNHRENLAVGTLGHGGAPRRIPRHVAALRLDRGNPPPPRPNHPRPVPALPEKPDRTAPRPGHRRLTGHRTHPPPVPPGPPAAGPRRPAPP